MKLQVLRFSSRADSTSGLLFEVNELGKHFLCYTLEDEARVLKVKGETRVPAGAYSVKLRKEHLCDRLMTSNQDESRSPKKFLNTPK